MKGHLSDDPAKLVRNLPHQIGSYDRALDILKKRYDNERAIINSNLKRLFQLEITASNSLDALKRMLDATNECIAAIKCYNIDTGSWDAILIFILSRQLDATSIQHWEEQIKGRRTIPKFSEFCEFLEIRINVLETTASTAMAIPRSQSSFFSNQKAKVLTTTTGSFAGKRCTICKMEHFAYKCPQFVDIPDRDKPQFIADRNLCTNCLFSHQVDECKSRYSCRLCGKRHHTTLHQGLSEIAQIHNLSISEVEPTDPEELQALEMQPIVIAHVNETRSMKHVKLATAMIEIVHNGKRLIVRALIDGGATANLISQRIIDTLKLPQTKVGLPITGACDTIVYNVRRKATFIIKPTGLVSNYAIQIPALVVPKVTSVSASPKERWPYLQGLELADPNWEMGGRIDVLLGSAARAEIILDGLIKGESGQPIAEKTELGWIISGGDGGQQQVNAIFTLKISDENLSKSLQRFWEVEELPKMKILTPDEQQAETIFTNTTKRCKDGRFMVQLPFKNEIPSLGESRQIAKKRYDSMERRFITKPELRAVYNQSIQEYLDLDQMELVESEDESSWPHSYIPQHLVFKDSSSTTKVRAVFDGSCKTSNGNSLNSQLLVGPTIQTELFSLLLHWRKGKYAISGDIEKMYRQVWVDPQHTDFQRILWKSPSTDELRSYRLKTVTFGVASAPFLAIRTLFLIADEICDAEPEMADKIKYQFYVDDFFDSVDTMEGAKHTLETMSNRLAEYGLLLRKWKANDKNILKDLKDSHKDSSPSNVFKTLGVQWDPSTDTFLFVPPAFKEAERWTKRTILSDISKLFDPLGWLSPCVIMAKIFIQHLWLLKIGWDENLPVETIAKWLTIRHQFMTSCAVKIPRWIGLKKDTEHISLLGFCDAADHGLCGVVYIRIQHNSSEASCKLLAAKTKVAPLKKISIPRLELCAASLLVTVMKKINEALKIPNLRQMAWTDSEIVLHWLSSHPSRWQTFVAHRVSEIQQELPPHLWRHISSQQNPADCATRGMKREELEQFKLWWNGPEFLMKNEEDWPKKQLIRPPANVKLEEKSSAL